MPRDFAGYTQPVSRETQDRFGRFYDIVKKWQQKINLIGSGTVDDIWERHILDSWQVAELIEPDDHVLDLGSGAGFPALVIACRQAEMGSGTVTMVEANGKKAAFLRAAIREMDFPDISGIRVLNERVEQALPELRGITTVTARAFASLSDLLTHCTRLPNQPRRGLFPKGRHYRKEIAVAEEIFRFDAVPLASRLEPDSVVLECSNWTRKTG